jgi:hypothetical protein
MAHCHLGLGKLCLKAGQRRDRHRHRLVPHHGDEVLATPGRKRAGTEGRMLTHLRPSWDEG